MREFTCDADRCRVYAADLPRNLAAPSHAAISIVRRQTAFRYVPEANLHDANREQEALVPIFNPRVASHFFR